MGFVFQLEDYPRYLERVGEATYLDVTRRTDPARVKPEVTKHQPRSLFPSTSTLAGNFYCPLATSQMKEIHLLIVKASLN